MAITIIDVSHWQGVLGWGAIDAAYRAGQIGGVIMKAGEGTRSGMSADAQFTRNQNQARQLGIPRQFYGFANPGSATGATQAIGMDAIVGPLLPGESVSLDLEDTSRKIQASDVDWALQFLRTLQGRTGTAPLIYMNSATLGRYDWSPIAQAGYPLWLANYGSNNGRPGVRPGSEPWPTWTLWQYTSKANLAGISPVDASLMDGTVQDFLNLGQQGAPMPDRRAIVEEIQMVLADAGFYSGRIDGDPGPGTLEATHAMKNALGDARNEVLVQAQLVLDARAETQVQAQLADRAQRAEVELRAEVEQFQQALKGLQAQLDKLSDGTAVAAIVALAEAIKGLP
jgi:GH25 family lysozyme M1 (1,4-beta-N-acetylmuramidase)